MLARLAADLLVVLHLGFILFVVLGGLLVLRWPRLAWLHIPAAVWGAFIELAGTVVCPLTPWENTLRHAAGQAGYAGGFVAHYIMPVVYPPGLTRTTQLWLGAAVVAVNATAYGVLVARRRLARRH
jgi:hypothetical protein